jgi:hypothetical protein
MERVLGSLWKDGERLLEPVFARIMLGDAGDWNGELEIMPATQFYREAPEMSGTFEFRSRTDGRTGQLFVTGFSVGHRQVPVVKFNGVGSWARDSRDAGTRS